MIIIIQSQFEIPETEYMMLNPLCTLDALDVNMIEILLQYGNVNALGRTDPEYL